jgi:antitoxin component YwqK of YwqJK toxin-antitoxin module
MNARTWCLVFFLVITGAVLSAQVIIDEDGLYHNEKNELYTGTYIEFYTNGNKLIEVTLDKGLINGPVTLYFETGQINEIRSYKNGEMDGTWTTWNEAGVKIGLANYKENLKHGDWFIWDDEGTLRFEMHYTRGKKTGVWKMFNEKGELESESVKD